MYFHGQLKRFKQSARAHLLKNMHDIRVPSELETEKISFLESFYQERLAQLETPTLSERDLQD